MEQKDTTMPLSDNSGDNGIRNNKTLNLLVIGNGFDLAHRLPTKYIDFLYFMALAVKQASALIDDPYKSFNYMKHNSDNIKKCINKYKNDFPKMANRLAKILNIVKTDKNCMKSLINYIDGNDWLRYFFFVYSISLENNENWIDLETELSAALLHINKKLDSPNDIKINRIFDDDKTFKEFFSVLRYYTPGYGFFMYTALPVKHELINYYNFKQYLKENNALKFLRGDSQETIARIKKEVFTYLYGQLNSFSKILATYLLIIEKYISIKPLPNLPSANFLISFNYTQTFSRLYPEIYKNLSGIDFIHGRLDNTNHLKSNIILGIKPPKEEIEEEYFQNNIHIFYKSYQRSNLNFKQNWTSFVAEHPSNKIHTDIIGHSMDVSDKEILSRIIQQSNTVNIYYRNPDELKSKRDNVFTLLGRKLYDEATTIPINKPYIQFINQEILYKNKE